MSDAEKPEGEGGDGSAPKSKKKLFVIIGAVLLLVVGAGVPMMMGGSKKPVEDEHQEEEVKHYATAVLDTFIVNLSANSAFLKVGIMLEYDLDIVSHAAGGAGGGEAEGGGHAGGESAGGGGGLPPAMKAREPMIRDAVIRILSSKKAEDVLSVEGKEHLKEELIEGINEATGLEEGPVVNLYFTEFMVQ